MTTFLRYLNRTDPERVVDSGSSGNSFFEWLGDNLFMVLGTIIAIVLLLGSLFFFYRAKQRHRLKKSKEKYGFDPEIEDEDTRDEELEGNFVEELQETVFDADEDELSVPVKSPPTFVSKSTFSLAHLERKRPKHVSMAKELVRKLGWMDVCEDADEISLLQAALDVILRPYTVTLSGRVPSEQGTSIPLDGCSWMLLPPDSRRVLTKVLAEILTKKEIASPRQVAACAETLCIQFQTKYRDNETLFRHFNEAHLLPEAKERIKNKRRKSAYELSKVQDLAPKTWKPSQSVSTMSSLRRHSSPPRRGEADYVHQKLDLGGTPLEKHVSETSDEEEEVERIDTSLPHVNLDFKERSKEKQTQNLSSEKSGTDVVGSYASSRKSSSSSLCNRNSTNLEISRQEGQHSCRKSSSPSLLNRPESKMSTNHEVSPQGKTALPGSDIPTDTAKQHEDGDESSSVTKKTNKKKRRKSSKFGTSM